tara:strand:+ start:299 stop:478 length:180 start_codon:yes stop_codon:yes gene_type:complete
MATGDTKNKAEMISSLKKKMTVKNFLNPTTIIADIKAISKILKTKPNKVSPGGGKSRRP